MTIVNSRSQGNATPQVEALLDCYGARRDAVLLADGERAETVRGTTEQVAQAVGDHLAGKRRAGVFPLRGEMVRVGVVDLDSHGPHARQDPATDAAAVTRALRRLGLYGLGEVTKRSPGRHVCMFLDHDASAREVREVFRCAVRMAGLDSEAVEVFPKQDRTAGDGVGNGLWLPYYPPDAAEGRTVFLAGDGRPLTLGEFLEDASEWAASPAELARALAAVRGEPAAGPTPGPSGTRGIVARILEAAAFTSGARRRGDKVEVRCLFHLDDVPSAVVYPDGRLYCSACDRSWKLHEWAATPQGRAVIGDLLAAELAALRSRPATSTGEVVVTTFDKVKPERISWLWRNRLPRGKLTVLKGDPGVGKTTLEVDWSARVTRGAPFPGDDRRREPADVLFVTAEDALADTLVPRLLAAGGDPARVHTIKIREQGVEHPPELTADDLSRVEQVVTEKGVALMVLDPLVAFTPTNVDAHRDHSMRRVLAPLAALAERTGTAVVATQHLNKSTQVPSPLYRGGGSIAIAAAARSRRQIDCHATGGGEGLVKMEHIAPALRRGEGMRCAETIADVDGAAEIGIVHGVDLAARAGPTSDLTCIFTIGVHPNGVRQVLSVQAGRWIGEDRLMRLVNTWRRFGGTLIVENNAFQEEVVEQLRAVRRGVEVLGWTTGRGERSLEFQVDRMIAEMTRGEWRIPNRNGVCEPQVAVWLDELLAFDPRQHTGDRLAASAIARAGIAQIGQMEAGCFHFDTLSR